MKILPTCIAAILVALLILNGLGAVAVYPIHQVDETRLSLSEDLQIAPYTLQQSDDRQYLKLQLDGSDSYLMSPGRPIMPMITTIFELPFGVTDIDVQIDSLQLQTHTIPQQVQPAPAPLPLSPITEYEVPAQKDEVIYQSTEPYPSQSYRYNVGVGVNGNFEHVTYVAVHFYPLHYIPADNILTSTEQADITISYTDAQTSPFSQSADYDLVMISPARFSDELQPLITHKDDHDVPTLHMTTEEIYQNYEGADEAEQIKYFIKDAIEEYNIKYVMLVGGLKSTLYAKGRDNANIGAKGWHVPVRYSNLKIGGDPGYPTDLYYADIYKEGGEFEDWDYDGDGTYAEWPDDSRPPEDIADLIPDVAVGRLACSSDQEVTDVVNKIITYETTTYGSDWFDSMIAVSGDGFMDQIDLDIQWDTSGIATGEYTIHAQSYNPDGAQGPIDTITIQADKTVESIITFNHDDHLNAALQAGYPAPPIAEIVSVSNGDILGNTDVIYEPSESEAYCNSLFWWANISYVDEILTIRGKSYDPQPYGNITDLHVWVEDSEHDIIFSEWRNNTPTYYEGEWATGEESVNGRGGALSYMPEAFDKEILWTSNGRFTGQQDVIDSFSQGYGFAFFSGHGSPGTWGDQYPGIPGNRQYGSVTGLTVSNIRSYFPFISQPLFPMKELANTNKLPVTVVGGCHNSLFNVSFIPSALHYYSMMLGRDNCMWTYIQAVPQCWSWYLVQLPETGAIATIGNTGLGWGWEGEYCTVGGGDGWITSEFFRQYGEHYGEEGYDVLGQVYLQTQTSYINNFDDFTLPECWWSPDIGWDHIDQQAVEQWVLLGDPSLQIGGYE